MSTNAEHHALEHAGARWRYPGRKQRCDRYFGEVVGCTGFSLAGEPVFDTSIPRAHPKGPFNQTLRVCAICARAPRRTEVLTEAA